MGTEKHWCVYILRCADNTLYTGITDDLDHRIKMHNEGRGAKYTRGRGPVTVVYQETFESRSAASKREYEIKQLTRTQKLDLIEKRS